MEKMLTYIDIYCERTDAGLLAEPLNLFSNLAFFAAAFATYRLIPNSDKGISLIQKKAQLALAGIIFSVAVGSSLFHAFANYLTQLLDVIPIGIMVFYALAYFVFFVLKQTISRVLLCWGIMIALCFITSLALDPFLWNGSQTYFGILISLFLLHIPQKKLDPDSFSILWSAGCFSVSLFFRTIDQHLCPSWPLGTHFLWHLCNGLTIYLMARSCLCKKQG